MPKHRDRIPNKQQEYRPEMLPALGLPFTGAIYRRADLHRRFGGNKFSGIVPSKREPVIMIFHTEEPAQQFYKDGFDDGGLYRYSAEGSYGHMIWTASNKAVRDHEKLGLDLLLFERAQRKDGLWRFASVMQYVEHNIEQRVDKDGQSRNAIVFGLVPTSPTADEVPTSEIQEIDLSSLRALAEPVKEVEPPDEPRTSVRTIYLRSEAVRRYALARSQGTCEACGCLAPFQRDSGEPFLEVHHIDRLADSGPDRVGHVAAVCPNCHRRCHYSRDRLEYNWALRIKIAAIEGEPTEPG